MSKLSDTARICFDLIIFVIVCLADIALHRWFEPFKRGFFCNDESLQYPLRENTISVTVLVIIVLSVPSLVIILVELFRQLDATVRERRKGNTSSSCCHLGYRLAQIYKQIGFYLFGLALILAATAIFKLCIGRLRPFFFEVCQPELPDGSTCEDPNNHGIYIEQYTCTNRNSSANLLKQLGQSFPSGHASIFFYSMLYLAIYLQAALNTRASRLLKHLLQFVFLMFAWFVGLTRISDYWHHWSDVVAGALLGSILAYAVAVYVAELFGRGGDRRCNSNSNSCSTMRPQVKPATSASSSPSAKSATPVLPVYTFGNVPYLPHPQHTGYGQTYHNYGYVS